MKKYILFDHDGVLVDTELWYFKAGERALADIGFTLDREQYLRDMTQGLATWAQARAAGIDEDTIDRQRKARDAYYQDYLRTEAIEIEGVVEILAELSTRVRRSASPACGGANVSAPAYFPPRPAAGETGPVGAHCPCGAGRCSWASPPDREVGRQSRSTRSHSMS